MQCIDDDDDPNDITFTHFSDVGKRFTLFIPGTLHESFTLLLSSRPKVIYTTRNLPECLSTSSMISWYSFIVCTYIFVYFKVNDLVFCLSLASKLVVFSPLLLKIQVTCYKRKKKTCILFSARICNIQFYTFWDSFIASVPGHGKWNVQKSR